MSAPCRFVLVALALLVAGGSCAQESITYLTAAEAANLLAGQNVTVSNATYNGHPLQLARLNSGASTLGVDEALAMTTGKAAFAATNYDYTPGGVSNLLYDNTPETEPDLNLIDGAAGGHYNVTILEFDFQTTAPAIVFNYVFASKEYPDYIDSGYNDVFGFFISGPNINGPFTNNAVNIATIDGDPVSINTIHGFSPDTHPELYVAGGPNNLGLAYDGRTVLIQATLNVACNQTYHAKLALCNVGDSDFHTGVFIQSHTLTSSFGPAPGPLTIQPIPACEGETLTLTVGGDPSWNYIWSIEQSGIGLQLVTTTASTSVDEYSVIAEYLPGCFLAADEEQGRAIVHTLNNAPPICSGGDLYVQADHLLDVTMPSSDALNENVFVTSWSGAPGSYSVIPGQYQQGHFSWVPSESDIGFHSVEFTFTDNNACGTLESTCQFNIKVMCRYCPTCVYYENRSPGGLPLPELTIAGACIVAGTDVDDSQTNGPVNTGDATVFFRAPVITLEPGFTSGCCFVADPDPDTCTEDCEECCDESGISITLLPNVFTPNGDGQNDHWEVLDELHPYCAYNANFFELWIYNQSGGELVAHRTGQGYCCPFISQAPGVDVVSSINWDGIADGGPFCGGCLVSDGVYFYVLVIESNCGSSEDYAGYIHVFGTGDMGSGGGNMVLQQEVDREVLTMPRDMYDDTPMVLQGTDKEVVLEFEDGVAVFPNPTTSTVTVHCVNELGSVEVRDALGRVLLKETGGSRQMLLNLGPLSSGTYNLIIHETSGTIHLERITKE